MRLSAAGFLLLLAPVIGFAAAYEAARRDQSTIYQIRMVNPNNRDCVATDPEADYLRQDGSLVVTFTKDAEKKKLPHVEVYFGPGATEKTLAMYDYKTETEISWQSNITLGPFLINPDHGLPNLFAGHFNITTDSLGRNVLGMGDNSVLPPGIDWTRNENGGSSCPEPNNPAACDGQGFNFCGPQWCYGTPVYLELLNVTVRTNE